MAGSQPPSVLVSVSGTAVASLEPRVHPWRVLAVAVAAQHLVEGSDRRPAGLLLVRSLGTGTSTTGCSVRETATVGSSSDRQPARRRTTEPPARRNGDGVPARRRTGALSLRSRVGSVSPLTRLSAGRRRPECGPSTARLVAEQPPRLVVPSDRKPAAQVVEEGRVPALPHRRGSPR